MINFYQFITDFITELSERRALIKEFNQVANDSFINGTTHRFLKVSITRGDSDYKHSMSSWLSGFRISVKNGDYLRTDEINEIGKVTLNNRTLLRQLMALGFDTLEVHGGSSERYAQWNMSQFSDLRNYYLNG